MSGIDQRWPLAVFLILCRIGGCLMVMPGFSSPRFPQRLRLFLCLASALALTPLLIDQILPALGDNPKFLGLPLVAGELLIGISIGFMGRLFFGALETLAMAASMAIGISSNVGAPINEDEPLSPLAEMVMLAATAVFFAGDIHWQVINALSTSYNAIPVGLGFDMAGQMRQILQVIQRAFFVALQVCSPFLIYGVIVNFAFGLINKLTPQVPVYFVSMPFSVGGGIALFFVIGKNMLALFNLQFIDWLRLG